MTDDKAAFQPSEEKVGTQRRSRLDAIATVSHEIRTPVSGIVGLSQLLLESDLGPEQLAWARMIQTSANRLLEIANDILDISKLEAGRVELNDAPYRVQELVDTVLETLRPKAAEKNIRLTGLVSPSLPETLRGDSRRVGQILFNLVGNAIKFTERGRIVVKFDALNPALGKEGKLLLQVDDTGIGIRKDMLPGVFEKFTQADISISRRFGGTGLGLAICRELAHLMGGQISAVSVPGQGSRFSVVLPLRPDLPANSAQGASGSLESHRLDEYRPVKNNIRHRGRILIAEDNEINRCIVVTALRKAGFHVTAATNGVRAIDAVRQQNFDAVLMDMQMPEMDGPQATRLIRALPGQRGRLPIVALTANAMAGAREQCLLTGMDAYLTKPIDPRRLVAVVADIVERGRKQPLCAVAEEVEALEAETSAELCELLGERSWQGMINGFVGNLPAIRDEAWQLLAAQAYPQLSHSMHRLVSSAGALGLKRIERLARRIEEAIHCQQYHETPELLASLQEEIALALTTAMQRTQSKSKPEPEDPAPV